MTTPFPFVSGAVLTAAQLNDITNLPINNQTASYTLLASDAGKRVVMNVASANTVTVDDDIFGVGDTVFIANKGAGETTVTAGAGVTINSASGLSLITNQSGQLIALSASSFLFLASDVAATASSGLTFLSITSFTTATSVSLPADTFSATYANYRMDLQLTALTADATFSMRMRAAGSDNTVDDYSTMFLGVDSGGTSRPQTSAGTTSISFGESDSVFHKEYSLTVDVKNPQLSLPTFVFGQYQFVDQAALFRAIRSGGGCFQASTSFDSLSFISSVASSMTGVVRVYGYSLS